MTSSTEASTDSGRVLSVRNSLLAMSGLCFVIMMVAVDQTVVSTALPTIVAELNGFSLYAWVANAYLLTSVITIPIFGRLGDYYGRKPFIIVAVLLFTAASVFCGLAGSMAQLVGARALQGIGGGMLIGTAFASVPDLFPDTRVRLRWQVLLSGAYGVANVIGPSLGGILTQYAGWRSVFFVNLPFGLLSLWFVWRCLPHIRQHQQGPVGLDWQGALLIALGLASLQLFVELLSMQGLTLLVGGLAALSLFSLVALYFWEKHCSAPLLPLEMFRNKSLAVLFCLSVFLGFALFVLLFYVPLLFQGGFGMSPQQAGLLITPLVVCITVGSIVNSKVVALLPNPGAMLFIGLGLLFIACLGLIFVFANTSLWLIILYMALGGIGLGFLVPNLTVFAQETAGRGHLGIATALLQSLRMIGGMLGMAVVGTLVSHFYASSVREALHERQGEAWAATLMDPQVVVNTALQHDFIQRLQSLGLEGEPYIQAARAALTGAVHGGLWLALAIVVLAFAWAFRLPRVRLGGPR